VLIDDIIESRCANKAAISYLDNRILFQESRGRLAIEFAKLDEFVDFGEFEERLSIAQPACNLIAKTPEKPEIVPKMQIIDTYVSI